MVLSRCGRRQTATVRALGRPGNVGHESRNRGVSTTRRSLRALSDVRVSSSATRCERARNRGRSLRSTKVSTTGESEYGGFLTKVATSSLAGEQKDAVKVLLVVHWSGCVRLWSCLIAKAYRSRSFLTVTVPSCDTKTIWVDPV